MNDLFWRTVIVGSSTYTECGIFLPPDMILRYQQAALRKIMTGLNRGQKQVTKLLWGYYGRIFEIQEIADLLGITIMQVRELEFQSNQIMLQPERLILFRDLYEVSN